MSADTMAALVVRGPGEHAIERVPRPPAGGGDAVVRVTNVALCGTDLRLLRGALHDAEYPVVPGHEWSGVVEAAPSAPELVGARVVGSNFLPCGTCEWCRLGKEQLCADLDELGFTLPGACAELVRLPAANLRPLPDDLAGDAACLLEPLGVALHAVERAPDLAGRSVLVMGAGAVGLLVAQLAAAAGADVAVADPVEARRALAGSLGLAPLPAVADVAARPPGARADVVFDATGSAAAFVEGLGAARPGGAYVLVGYSGDDAVPFAPSALMLAELDVHGVLSGYGQLDNALRAVASGAVRLAPLVGEVAPLRAYADVLAGGGSAAALRLVFSVGDDG